MSKGQHRKETTVKWTLNLYVFSFNFVFVFLFVTVVDVVAIFALLCL